MFSKTEAGRYRNLIKGIVEGPAVSVTDIDDVNDEGLLYDYANVPVIVRKFQDARIEALFIPLCNFGEEGPLCEVVRQFDVPVLLYGPRDEAPGPDGLRLRDTQCGLFAVGKVLGRCGVPFTYLTNTDPESAYFRDGFERFVRVAQTVRAMRTLRILQLGTRPTPFLSVTCNEGELMERFGAEIIPVGITELTEISDRIRAENGEALAALTQSLTAGFSIRHADPLDAARRLASLKLAIMELRDRYRATCAAIQCWTAMQRTLRVFPCAVNGLLADEGFPVACETDVHGAISAALLQAAAGNGHPHFFADVTVRHPTDDNAELLWHCGPFPPSLAKPGTELCILDHWTHENDCTGDLAYPLRDGEITVCRFDGMNGRYSLFTGEGSTTEGPRTVGTYVWLKVNDWPLWERRLVTGPYIHHVAGAYGHCAEVLTEACRYIPGLEPDPCEPDASALQKRWRG